MGDDPVRQQRCSSLLRAFETEGCRMVEMTCEEHDKMAASSQFITHTVGRMLGRMALADTPINTKGYESLLSLVGNTNKDSFDLYYGLFMYNENATEELARMEAAFDAVKRQLFDQLHDVVRTKIFYSVRPAQHCMGLAQCDTSLTPPAPRSRQPARSSCPCRRRTGPATGRQRRRGRCRGPGGADDGAQVSGKVPSHNTSAPAVLPCLPSEAPAAAGWRACGCLWCCALPALRACHCLQQQQTLPTGPCSTGAC